MEEAEHALWRAAGLSITPPPEDGIGFPRVAASFDFRRPLRFEDEFEVEIAIAEIGEKSIRYRALVEKDGTTIATGSLTIACGRKRAGEPMRATAIPAGIARRLRVAQAAEAGA